MLPPAGRLGSQRRVFGLTGGGTQRGRPSGERREMSAMTFSARDTARATRGGRSVQARVGAGAGAAATFAASLRTAMADRAWNQNRLAAEVGTTPSVISRWVRAEAVPTPESCRRLAEVLGVPVDRLLSLAGHRPPDAAECPLERDPSDPRVQLANEILAAELPPEVVAGLRAQVRQVADFARRQREAKTGPKTGPKTAPNGPARRPGAARAPRTERINNGPEEGPSARKALNGRQRDGVGPAVR
jgi:transcriptional regulator with XRE-family HTH domain